MQTQTIAAALVYTDDENRDLATNILWSSINQLRAQGIKIGGLMNKCTEDGHHVSDIIQSISDSREYIISQCLGTGSTGCRLDTVALAESSIVLRDAIDEHVDVLVINKFGKAEAEGSGLVDEYTRAIAEHIPVLSLVDTKYLPDWQDFTAELGEELPLNMDTVMNWILSRLDQQ